MQQTKRCWSGRSSMSSIIQQPHVVSKGNECALCSLTSHLASHLFGRCYLRDTSGEDPPEAVCAASPPVGSSQINVGVSCMPSWCERISNVEHVPSECWTRKSSGFHFRTGKSALFKAREFAKDKNWRGSGFYCPFLTHSNLSRTRR